MSVDPIKRLRKNVEESDRVLVERWEAIHYARSQGITWAAIGEALDRKSQTVQEWYRRTPAKRKARI